MSIIDFGTKLKSVQKALSQEGIEGWLLYDFRRNNDLACNFLEIPHHQLLTRRFFYWIPQQGAPIKIVHAIEQKVLAHLPGEERVYQGWRELEASLADVLKGAKRVAMEYSPRNAIPYVSKVDGGTIDLIREFGITVVSSANLLQQYSSVLTPDQVETHLAAARVLDQIVSDGWAWIRDALQQNRGITERSVQEFLLQQIALHRCVTSDPPICAVNAHSADPHYTPTKKEETPIRWGDWILLDLWCKQERPHAVYGDITRVAVAAAAPTQEQQKIFAIVKAARDAGTDLVKERFARGEPVMGCEVDQCCRSIIQEAGYGSYFIHRTGHNIGEQDHGSGAHLDHLETEDSRLLLPGTCFSIEPGIYLPGNFGVRLEYDLYVSPSGHVQVTGGIQDAITCLA
jgi:Xaa-Pro dipeptidase